MEKKLKLKYVTFEQAKLLKEKQFGLTPDCYITLHSFYDEEGNLITEPSVYKRNTSENHLGALTLDNVEVGISQGLDNSLDGIYLAPEQWQVVEWLRVNHNIFIEVRHLPFNQRFGYRITGKYNEKDKGVLYPYNFTHFNSPQETYSAAFDYVLKELI